MVTIEAISKKSNSGTFYPALANYRDPERDRGSGRDRDPAVPTISSSNEQNRCRYGMLLKELLFNYSAQGCLSVYAVRVYVRGSKKY